MKKYRKYILLIAFITFFSFTNTYAKEFTPECKLDTSKKMDWAVAEFPRGIVALDKLSDLEKSSVFGLELNGNTDTSRSLFTGFYSLVPRLHYNNAAGCNYNPYDNDSSESEKKISLEIIDKDKKPIEIITTPKNLNNEKVITFFNTSEKKIALSKFCKIRDINNPTIKDCSITFSAKDADGTPKESDIIKFEYTGNLNKEIKIQPEYFFTRTPDSVSSATCNLTADDISFTAESLNVNAPILKDQIVILNIKTKNKCDGFPLAIRLRTANYKDTTVDVSNGLDKEYIAVESTPYTNLWVKYKTGEEECYSSPKTGKGASNDELTNILPTGIKNEKEDNSILHPFGGNDFTDLDCRMYVEIFKRNGKNITSELIVSTSKNIPDSDSLVDWFPVNLTKGILGAECDGSCGSDDWYFPKKGTNGKAPFNKGAEIAAIDKPYYDTESPCYGRNDKTGKKEYLKNCYEFLAPLDGIEKDADGNLQKNFKLKGDRIAILDIRTYELGDYINKIFQMAISILGILAVIMIIVAGIQYMTVESIYGKSDAKERIIGAVTGLMLSIAIFVILNTINPQLLQINFGSNLDIVSIGDSPSEANEDGTYGDFPYKGNWPPANKGFKTLRDGDKNSLKTIIPGVYINAKECENVGEKKCTSTYFNPPTFNKVKEVLLNMKNESGASKIVITGGSEYWLHSTHGPNKPILDIRSNNDGGNDGNSINKLLSGSENYPAQCYQRTNIKKDNKNLSYISFAIDEARTRDPNTVKQRRVQNDKIGKNMSKLEEPYGGGKTCTWNPTEHWHIAFK